MVVGWFRSLLMCLVCFGFVACVVWLVDSRFGDASRWCG